MRGVIKERNLPKLFIWAGGIYRAQPFPITCAQRRSSTFNGVNSEIDMFEFVVIWHGMLSAGLMRSLTIIWLCRARHNFFRRRSAVLGLWKEGLLLHFAGWLELRLFSRLACSQAPQPWQWLKQYHQMERYGAIQEWQASVVSAVIHHWLLVFNLSGAD